MPNTTEQQLILCSGKSSADIVTKRRMYTKHRMVCL